MRVLVVGGGGREHALVWRLAQNATIDRLFAAPGNPGIERDAVCVDVAADDVAGLLRLVERERIDLTVVGPEAPLVAGLADALIARGQRVFGPTKDGARIEGSKVWAKELCRRYGIPAASSESFTELAPALEHLEQLEPPYVVKADGLAAGKGVVVAETRADAEIALRAALVDAMFGEAGAAVLIEEHLTGREVSAFALSDGREVLPLGFAHDHKRVGDGDTGPNTGGMGAYAPVPWIDDGTAERIWTDVVRSTVRALSFEGVRYQGVLYAGLMLTDRGPKVLEFNCRFGDPETQALIPRLRSDLAEMLLACVEGNLGVYRATWSPQVCVAIVAASGGYPGGYETGIEISGLDEAERVEGALVFHAGTAERAGRVVTAGGRVLTVSALGDDANEARERALEAISRIRFEGMHHRTDIATDLREEGG
jgi:phosphoribosylamine--glycine ligase